MLHVRLLSLALLATACAGAERDAFSTDADGALLPDTQTVAGVLEMRHGADAFERAPQWRVDTQPLVMFDGGEEVDLSGSGRMHLLSDGQAVVQVWGGNHGGDLWLFDASGRPVRVLARGGAGPGEMQGSAFVVTVPGDTIYLVDGTNGYVNRYTADSGFIGGVRTDRVPPNCVGPLARLSNGQHVGIDGCGQARRLSDGSLNPMVALFTTAADFTRHDSIAAVAGTRMRLVSITVNGQTHGGVLTELTLGQRTTVTAVDSSIVVGSGEGGYVLDLRNLSGVTTQRIVVERPVVLMNARLRQDVIDYAVAQAVANGDPNFPAARARELADQRAYADTVGAYVTVSATAGGTVWVRDMPMPGDTTGGATAFRRDGAILGRLTWPVSIGRLIWFDDDRAMIMHFDDDGVVRYGVYRIVKG